MKKTVGLVILGVLLGPVAAQACGGLFCSRPPPTTPTPPEPVDQTAERIIFDIGDQQITAHVWIQYTGSADDFAWVVPVPSVPDVADSSAEIFDTLNNATSMQVSLPAAEPCAPGPVGVADATSSGFGCGMSDASIRGSAGGSEFSGSDLPPVTVFAHDFTGNYEYHVVGADDTSELVKWLGENEYNVSENMTPVMDVYNGGTTKFLALKLKEGKTASDIVPVQFTYVAEKPMIPIQLTAVAAQPLMGILVFIKADVAYRTANYGQMRPDTSEILFDTNGDTSYFEWVGRAVDEANGRLFVTEFAGPTSEGYITRLYSRLSPHQMTLDPVFEPHGDATYATGRALDLTGHPTLWRCNGTIAERIPSLCAFNYCGRDAECGIMDGLLGCICPEGAVAQTITGPDGLDTVTCVPETNQYGITDEAGGKGGPFDPCKDIDCGSGSCVLKGGFPTCQCDDGSIACLETGGVLACIPVNDTLTTFGPGAGSESQPTIAAASRPASNTAWAGWPGQPLMLLLLALFAFRTRLSVKT